MKDREIYFEFLQVAWRKAEGDVNLYAEAVHPNLIALAQEDQTLFLQMAIAVAKLPWSQCNEE